MKQQPESGVKTKCAASQPEEGKWSTIDWDRCQRRVKKIQGRNVKSQKKAIRQGKSLQGILVISCDVKALAVKRVTSK